METGGRSPVLILGRRRGAAVWIGAALRLCEIAPGNDPGQDAQAFAAQFIAGLGRLSWRNHRRLPSAPLRRWIAVEAEM